MKNTLGVLVLHLFFTSAFSVTYPPEAIEKQLKEADFIGTVQIEKIEPLEFVAGVGQKNVATARTEQGEIIKIAYFGGEKGDRGYFFSGLPRPYVGRTYQAHLKRVSPDLYEITGYDFGLSDLNPTRTFSRNRTDGSNGDGDGPFLYWDPKYFPIPYFISEPTFRGRPELISEIDRSFTTWRDIERTRLEFVAMGCSAGQYNENDGINAIILVTKNWPFDSAAIAITRNFYVAGTSEYSGLILDSDILLNAVNHQFAVGVEAGKHDVRNIVTHEVGHFLGLGHEITPVNTESTMYAVASTAETKKQSLSSNDVLGVESAYQGVGQKLSQHNTTCSTAETNVGCRLGVIRPNDKGEFPLTFVICSILILMQIPVGRIFLKKSSSL